MKKWKSLSLATCLMMSASAAFASVPQDSVYLGGIGYGSDGSYVQRIYGTPTEIEQEHTSVVPSGLAVEYEYGHSVSILLENDLVYQVEVSANNGWQTPEGVHVGMDASVVEATYGAPDMVRGDKRIYTVAENPDVGMVFEIENGKIDEIEIGKIR